MSGVGSKLRVFLIAIALTSLGSAAPASAFVTGGKPWPGGIIRYYNSDRAARSEVAAATAAWNHSGAHVHFVATSRARASVIVYPWPKHISLATGCFSVDLGCASVGFIGKIGNHRYWSIGADGRLQSKGSVWLKPVKPSHLEPAGLMAVVATHEFGHVLGLQHSHRCATMEAPADATCKFPSDNGNGYVCNPLQTDDARGAVALYGGHAHKYSIRTCHYVSPPIAPLGLTASLINRDPSTGYLGDIQVQFKAPPGEILHEPGLGNVNTVYAYVYSVNLGSCVVPGAGSYGDMESPNAELTTTVQPSPAQPGTYCVAVENEDVFSQLSAPAEVYVTVPPV